MKDIVKKYKKKKFIKNFSIIMTSLVMAITINTFLTITNIGNSVKVAVFESSDTIQNANFYLEKNKDSSNSLLEIKIGKKINKLKNLSFSLSFNPESIEIKDILPKKEGLRVIKISSSDGTATFSIISKEPIDLNTHDILGSIVINKKSDKIENINISNTFFKDSTDEIFYLSTSGISL